jgi:hypothetical protein
LEKVFTQPDSSALMFPFFTWSCFPLKSFISLKSSNNVKIVSMVHWSPYD